MPDWPVWHIMASLYAPGTIAVNVTWMERGINVGQTHGSMYPSIFNRLRAITRYLLEIATFSYPLAFNAPVGVIPLDDLGYFWWVSRMTRLQYSAKYPRKVKALSRVHGLHACHRRQTDRRICHAISQT